MSDELTPDEIAKATAEGERIANKPSAVVEAYVRDGVLCLVLKNGVRVEIPVESIGELSGATPEQVREIVVSPMRDSISFPARDVDIYVPGLLADLAGHQKD
jgi:hypothetical protein